jgi:hypothetical protein
MLFLYDYEKSYFCISIKNTYIIIEQKKYEASERKSLSYAVNKFNIGLYVPVLCTKESVCFKSRWGLYNRDDLLQVISRNSNFSQQLVVSDLYLPVEVTAFLEKKSNYRNREG